MSAPAARLAPPAVPRHARVHSVWELTQRVTQVLHRDDLLPDVWVRGEVSNVTLARSGHAYFTLKDGHAQIACVAWNARETLRFELKDGLGLVVHGRVTLYGPRGQVQLVADDLVPDGHGRLHLAYEQLKERLAAEGLLRADRKRPLPPFPRRIGVVTSAQGAALRDILRILAARYPLAAVVVKPVRVQGDGAALEIASAIALLNRLQAADLLIVGRGGGSLEDLWAFNEEAVARAIHASAIPVVSAVGHETDVTISDFVADLRAPTPTAAAEMATPDREDLAARLALRERALATAADRALRVAFHRLEALERRAALRKPDRLLEAWRQRLDEAARRLDAGGQEVLRAAGDRLGRAAALLDSYSPLRTLQRGYAIVAVDGRPTTTVQRLRPGTRATLRVADGSVQAVIEG